MDRIKRCLTEGKQSESEAILILEKYFSKTCEIIPSSVEDDINKHIDIYLLNKIKNISIGIDVKDKPDGFDQYQFIEYSNVNRKPGWIFGEAKYIMFKTSTHWLLVDRQELLIECNKKWVEYKSPVIYQKGKVEFYNFYTRALYDRHDMMMKVPIDFIYKLSKYKLKI